MLNVLSILGVSSDPRFHMLLDTAFASEGHRVHDASDDEEAFRYLDEEAPDEAPDLVIRDCPRALWKDRCRLEDYFERVPRERTCVLTDSGDLAWHRYANSLGVELTLTKPLLRGDLERLLGRLKPANPPVYAPAPVRAPSPSACNGKVICEELGGGRFFLAACPAMREVHHRVRLLASVDVPMLILGESGVGKEVVSLLLHKHSNRSREAFVNVNCAALPSDLLESELFGYEAGAFTGAAKAKPGKFDLAHRGIILLDEIGEMSAPMQAKLLHVLQNGQFCRLGARAVTQVDAHVLAATNIDIEEAVADKRFREDLFYRLNAFQIHIPPLRARREEIPFLLRESFRRQARDMGREGFEPSPALLGLAQEYGWPGNLRELRNFVTRRLVLRDDADAVRELESKIRRGPGRGLNCADEAHPYDGMRSIVREVKDKAEIRLIGEALGANGWNRRRAAGELNISYRALLYKIQQYGLQPPPERIRFRSAGGLAQVE